MHLCHRGLDAYLSARGCCSPASGAPGWDAPWGARPPRPEARPGLPGLATASGGSAPRPRLYFRLGRLRRTVRGAGEWVARAGRGLARSGVAGLHASVGPGTGLPALSRSLGGHRRLGPALPLLVMWASHNTSAGGRGPQGGLPPPRPKPWPVGACPGHIQCNGQARRGGCRGPPKGSLGRSCTPRLVS